MSGAAQESALEPEAKGVIVAQLQGSLRDGQAGLKYIPALVKQVLKSNAWNDRVIRQTKQRQHFDTFVEFLLANVPEGLGATIDGLKQLISGDPEAIDLFDQAVGKGKPGPKSVYNIHESNRPAGTSVQRTIRRLRTANPQLHDRVIAGELSPNAAAIEAGWRKRMIQHEPTVQGFTKAIQKHLTAEQIMQLKERI